MTSNLGTRKEISERVSSLVNTSVEDMSSSLNFYNDDNDKEVLELALVRVTRRGEKTKAKLLRSKQE